MKIIQLMHHSITWQRLPGPYLDRYRQGNPSVLTDEFHERVAKEIIKRTKKYEIECWQPEKTIKKVLVKKINGITFKMFPSFYLRFTMEYSIPLLRELRKESKKRDILIHLHGIHNDLADLVAYLFRDIPILGAGLGGAPYRLGYRNANKLYSKLYYIPHCILEPSILRGMDHVIVGNKIYLKTLSELHPHVEMAPNDGVDFEKIAHLPDKPEARRLLNLPRDKKIMLYVGRFYKLKGLHHSIHTYQELKKKIDVELVLIGGNKTDPLYNKAIKSGAIVIELVPHGGVMPYYKAADVNLMLPFGEHLYGIGAAQRESICCGTPVVSPNLILSALGTDEEIKQYGEIPKSIEDVEKCVCKIFDDPTHYKNCSEIMKKYVSWDAVIRHHIEIYDELFEKYYG